MLGIGYSLCARGSKKSPKLIWSFLELIFPLAVRKLRKTNVSLKYKSFSRAYGQHIIFNGL